MASATSSASTRTKPPVPIMSARSCPAIHIPSKISSETKSTLRVYSGKNIGAPGCEYKGIPVGTHTTSMEVITDALDKFGLVDHAIHYELRYTRQASSKHRRFIPKLGKGSKSYTLLANDCPLIVSDAYDDDRFFELVRRKGAPVPKGKPTMSTKSIAGGSKSDEYTARTVVKVSTENPSPQQHAGTDNGVKQFSRQPPPQVRRAMTSIDVYKNARPACIPPSDSLGAQEGICMDSPDYASVSPAATRSSSASAFYSPVVARPICTTDFNTAAPSSESAAPGPSPVYAQVVRKSQRMQRQRTREQFVLNTDQARPAPPPVPQRQYQQQHATREKLLQMLHKRPSCAAELTVRPPPPPPPTSVSASDGQNMHTAPSAAAVDYSAVELYSPQTRAVPPHHTLNSTRIPRSRASRDGGYRTYGGTRINDSGLLPPEIDMSIIPFRCNSTDTGNGPAPGTSPVVSARVGCDTVPETTGCATDGTAGRAHHHAGRATATGGQGASGDAPHECRGSAATSGAGVSSEADTTAFTEPSLDNTHASVANGTDAETTSGLEASTANGAILGAGSGTRTVQSGTDTGVMMILRSVPLLPVPPLMVRHPHHGMFPMHHPPWQQAAYPPPHSWHAHAWPSALPGVTGMPHPSMHGHGSYLPLRARLPPPPPPLVRATSGTRSRRSSGIKHGSNSTMSTNRSSTSDSNVHAALHTNVSTARRSSSVDVCDGSFMDTSSASSVAHQHRSQISTTPTSPSSRKADCRTLDECEIAIRDLETEKTKFRGLANKRRRQKINVMIRSLQQLWQELLNESKAPSEGASGRSSISSTASLNPTATEFIPTWHASVPPAVSTTKESTKRENSAPDSATPSTSAPMEDVATVVVAAPPENTAVEDARNDERSAYGHTAEGAANVTVLDDPLPALPANAPVPESAEESTDACESSDPDTHMPTQTLAPVGMAAPAVAPSVATGDGAVASTACTPQKRRATTSNAASVVSSATSTEDTDPLPATPASETPAQQQHRLSKRTVLTTVSSSEAISTPPLFAIPATPTPMAKPDKENPVPVLPPHRTTSVRPKKATDRKHLARGLSARPARGMNATGGAELDVSVMLGRLKPTGIRHTVTPARQKAKARGRTTAPSASCNSPTVLNTSVVASLGLKRTGQLTPRVKGMRNEAAASRQAPSPSTMSFQEKKAMWM